MKPSYSNKIILHTKWLYWVTLFSLVLFVYWPGLSGPFVFDDFPNIVNNTYLAIDRLDPSSMMRAAFSSGSGPLNRPISMLSFALNSHIFGLLPFNFKLTNLVIHLLNGVCLYVLSILIIGTLKQRSYVQLEDNQIRLVSFLLSAAWLLHPLNVTSVLYIVQRMTSLAALFTILGLIVYLHGRLRMNAGKAFGILQILIGLVLFLPLAALSKENGLLLPLLMLVLEFTLLNFETRTLHQRRFLIGVFLLTVALPGLLGLIYLVMHPNWILGGYANREFTLPQRLMTEARVMFFYLKSIVLPSTAELGMYHDDIPISQSLLSPITTILSISGLFILTIAGFLVRKRHPILSLGILFFLAGHIIESTIIPLEITFEHRNYLPMYGILLILFFYLLYPLAQLSTLKIRQFASVGLITLLSVSTHTRADQWKSAFLFCNIEASHHPLSPRANAEVGANYGDLAAITTDKDLANQFYNASKAYFEKSVSLQKSGIDGLLGLVYYAALLGKPIDKSWLSQLSNYLTNAPASGNATDKLHRLVTCYGEGKCRIDKSDVRLLLEASLNNPRLSGLNKAGILEARAYYLANIEHDTKGALESTYQAAATVPNVPEYRANLIKFLIALRQFDKAKFELETARKIDTLNTNRQVLEQLEKSIDDAEKQTKPRQWG